MVTLHGGLSLTRRTLDQIELTTAAGETIQLTVLQIRPGVVKLHFAAPASVRILRSELAERATTDAA